jgi:hypothetical protein
VTDTAWTEDDLVKLTVNLIPKAYEALTWSADLRADTKTDTVNRALQFYAHWIRHTAELDHRRSMMLSIEGERFFITRLSDGGRRRGLLHRLRSWLGLGTCT